MSFLHLCLCDCCSSNSWKSFLLERLLCWLWYHKASSPQLTTIITCWHTEGAENRARHSSAFSTLWIQENKTKKKLNGPTVAFTVCEPFDFPKPSLLMASQQHETWHVIYYSVHVPCYLSPLHMAPVVSRHPNPFPQARGCFCGNHYIAPLPQRNGVTMMSNHSQSRLSASNSDRIFNNWPCPLCWPNC